MRLGRNGMQIQKTLGYCQHIFSLLVYLSYEVTNSKFTSVHCDIALSSCLNTIFLLQLREDCGDSEEMLLQQEEKFLLSSHKLQEPTERLGKTPT